jgi:hypothetical protein
MSPKAERSSYFDGVFIMYANTLSDPMYAPLVYLLLIYLGAVAVIFWMAEKEHERERDSHIAATRSERATDSVPCSLPQTGFELKRKRTLWGDTHTDEARSARPSPLASSGTTTGGRKPSVSAGSNSEVTIGNPKGVSPRFDGGELGGIE